MSPNSDKKRIAKNTIFLYIRMILVMVVSLFTSRVILEALGAEDYGLYNVVGGVVTIMSFLNGALSASTSRFLTYELGKGNEERLIKTFSASFTLHCLVALIVLIIAETIGLWFFYNKMVIPDDRMTAAFWVYQFSVITTMVNFTQVPYNASLIAHEKMSIYAYVGLYEAVSRLAIVYLIFVSPIDKLVFYALLLMLNTCAIRLFYRFFTTSRYKECKLRIVKDKELYKTLLGYSGWDLFGGVAVACQGQGINILLNLFFGPVVNAARAVAFQVQGAVTMFVNNFLLAIRPQVVKKYAEGNTPEMFSLTFNAAKYAYTLMLALILPICFEINFILDIWLNGKAPENTAIFVILVLVTCLMETYHSCSLMPYHAIGKIKLGNVTCGTLMILALPLSYIALHFGAPAYMAFVIVFAVNLLQMLFGWMIIHRYEKFSYRSLIKDVYLPTIAVTLLSVIMPIIIINTMNQGWLRLVVLTVMTEMVILGLTYFILLNRENRQKLHCYIKKKLHKSNETINIQ